MLPVKQISGFILSLLLTALAFWGILGTRLSLSIALPGILLLAFAQAFIQLFFFMHINESKSKLVKYLVIYLGIAIAIIIAAGSIWVMNFKME